MGRDGDPGTFLDQAIGTTAAMGGGSGGVILGTLKAGINFLGSVFGSNKKEKKVRFFSLTCDVYENLKYTRKG